MQEQKRAFHPAFIPKTAYHTDNPHSSAINVIAAQGHAEKRDAFRRRSIQ
jgi:hypothetical protein